MNDDEWLDIAQTLLATQTDAIAQLTHALADLANRIKTCQSDLAELRSLVLINKTKLAGRLSAAKKFLEQTLANGDPVPVTEIFAEADRRGLKKSNVYAARISIGGIAVLKFGNRWCWVKGEKPDDCADKSRSSFNQASNANCLKPDKP